ncbi:MAG: DUF2927 domain-containing protein [Oceanospirillaceae bacterium]|nr:DUF2927 domain-containing protein [Oceanospirillaceae bacterium]
MSARWLLLFALLSWPAVASERWQQPQRLAQIFAAVALTVEHGDGPAQIRKWQQPVRVWIDHRVGDRVLHERLTDMHLRHLGAITGLDIARVGVRERANLVLVFTRADRWAEDLARELGPGAVRYMHGAVCMGGLHSQKGVIRSAAAVIPVDQARMHGKLVACIVEELTQALGLANDSELAYPSVFNDLSPDDLLTDLDCSLLRILYDPRVAPGLNADALGHLLPDIIDDLRRQDLYRRALSDARHSELRGLLAQ